MSSQKAAIRALAKERNKEKNSKRKSSGDGSSKHKHKKHRAEKDDPALIDEVIPEDQAPPLPQTSIVGTSSQQIIEIGSDDQPREPDIPFVPAWSILTRDSALGSHTICKEMVTNCVLPKDRDLLNTCTNSSIASCTYDMIVNLTCYAGEAARRLEKTTELYDEEKSRSKKLEAVAKKRGADLDKLTGLLAEADTVNASLKMKLAKLEMDFEAAKKKWVEEGSELFLDGFEACKKAVTGISPDFPVDDLEVPDEDEEENTEQQQPTDQDPVQEVHEQDGAQDGQNQGETQADQEKVGDQGQGQDHPQGD